MITKSVEDLLDLLSMIHGYGVHSNLLGDVNTGL